LQITQIKIQFWNLRNLRNLRMSSGSAGPSSSVFIRGELFGLEGRKGERQHARRQRQANIAGVDNIAFRYPGANVPPEGQDAIPH
jgi:hypothetical protein